MNELQKQYLSNIKTNLLCKIREITAWLKENGCSHGKVAFMKKVNERRILLYKLSKVDHEGYEGVVYECEIALDIKRIEKRRRIPPPDSEEMARLKFLTNAELEDTTDYGSAHSKIRKWERQRQRKRIFKKLHFIKMPRDF